MKILGSVGTAAGLIILGCATAAYGQQAQQDEPKPKEQEQSKPAHQENPSMKEKQHPQDEKNVQRDNEKRTQDESKQEQQQDKREQQQGMKQEEHQEHASKASVGNHGGRIPEEKFRSSFGRQHTFVIRQPVIVENRPRFQYSGYWFEFVDAWPVGWSYSDDCYIDYIDGEYFLFDPVHPGVRLAIVVIG